MTMRSDFEKWLKSESKARACFRLDPAYVWQAAYQVGALAMRERAAKCAENCDDVDSAARFIRTLA